MTQQQPHTPVVVRFNLDLTEVVENEMGQITMEEKCNTWFSGLEIKRIQQSCTAEYERELRNPPKECNDHYGSWLKHEASTRGLVDRTKMPLVRNNICLVLTEQRRQRLEEQNDPIRLAKLYHDASKDEAKRAAKRGKMDHRNCLSTRETKGTRNRNTGSESIFRRSSKEVVSAIRKIRNPRGWRRKIRVRGK